MSLNAVLNPRVVGMTFRMQFELLDDWIGSNFSEIYFTLRRYLPASTVPDDTDAGVLAQVTKTGGGITFPDVLNPQSGEVRIAPSVTRLWTPGDYYFDVKAIPTGGLDAEPIVRGTVPIVSTPTRSGP